MSFHLAQVGRSALSLGKPATLLLAAGLMPTLSDVALAAGNSVDIGTRMPGIADILSHTPLWVWPLIAYGLFIGWSRTRDRVVAPSRLFIMPAIITGLALYNFVASGISAIGLLGIACGAVAGAFAGATMTRRRPATLLADGRLALRGDWLPLALIIAIIIVRYAKGIALGMDPALAQEPGFVLASAMLSGLFAATMIARTIGMLASGFFKQPA